MKSEISFTTSELAYLLGKSPVTIRAWDRKGDVTLPRNSADARRVSPEQVREVAQIAQKLGRISEERRNVIDAAMTLFDLLEKT